jgi:polysaccharide biosynthesis/export protein
MLRQRRPHVADIIAKTLTPTSATCILVEGIIHSMQPVKLGARPWCYATAGLFGLMVAGACACAQTVETPQETNDRIKALSALARYIPHDYIIGSGDTIGIDVYDVKELSRDVRVSQTGTIGLPLIPVRLQVKGLTETQAEQKIAEVLEANGLVSHPEVSVSVKDRKSKPITVVGAVPHPMVYQAERPVTLLEVLAEAGGVSADAGDTAIVTRPISAPADTSLAPANSNEDVIPPSGQDVIPPPTSPSTNNDAPVSGGSAVGPRQAVTGTSPVIPAPNANFPSAEVAAKDVPMPTMPPALSNTLTVNLNQLMESGDPVNNIILQAGDIVTVPHAGIVYVIGAVGRPGGYVLANDRAQMTTLKMLALTGGLNLTAKSDRAVIIRRDRQGQQHEQVVDLKKIVERKAEDVRLEASDILYVPDSRAKKVLYKAGEAAIGIGTGVALYRVAYR